MIIFVPINVITSMNNNADFGMCIESIINDGFTSEGLQKLDRMQNNSKE